METMCNLYSMTSNVEALRRLFGRFEGDMSNLPPFEEIYPGKPAPVLRRTAEGGLKLETMRWGFPPPASAGKRPITNVRNLSSPFWRTALSRPDRRCIVPATSFCEWKGEVGKKEKVWFSLRDEDRLPFTFAGVWRPTEEGPAMAFLTCDANPLVAEVHPKAMPVMLDPEGAKRWLEDDHESACALAVPYDAEAMHILA
jgi:putative SOS response-associated peptidase YedK